MFFTLFRFLYFCLRMLDFALIALFSLICALLPISINKLFMHRMFRMTCRGFLRFLNIRCHIYQKYKGVMPKNFILISNHPSGVDILAINSLFSVYPLAKIEVQNWWFLGRIARAAGVLFVKREDQSSRGIARNALAIYAREGKNLLIYPEGGCFGRNLRPFKQGAFDTAILSGLPILPVYLQYGAEITLEWGEYGLVQHILNVIRSPDKHIHCYIFNPIAPDAFCDGNSLKNYVHKLYQVWEAKYRL